MADEDSAARWQVDFNPVGINKKTKPSERSGLVADGQVMNQIVLDLHSDKLL